MKSLMLSLLLVAVVFPVFGARPFATYSTTSSDKALFAKLKTFDCEHPSSDAIKEIAGMRKHVSEDISELVSEFCASAAIIAERTAPGTIDEIRPLLGGRTKIDEECYIKCVDCDGKGFTTHKCRWCNGNPFCVSCKGTGVREIKRLSGEIKKSKCSSCNGTGTCPKCGGTQEERTDCLKCGKRGTYWNYPRAKASLSTLKSKLQNFLNVASMSDDMSLSLVIVRGSVFEGTGTLVNFNGDKYVMTDSALLIGAKKLTLQGPTGSDLDFSEIKVAVDRELALFKIKSECEGVFLEFSDKPPLADSWLWPFAHCGNSIVSRVITAKKKDAVLLDTDFSFGGVSCGAPVVNGDKVIFGIVGATDNYPVSQYSTVLPGCEQHIIRTDNIGPGLFTVFERERYRGILSELADSASTVADCSNAVQMAWEDLNANGKSVNLEYQIQKIENAKKFLGKSRDWPLPQISDFAAKLNVTCSLVEEMTVKMSEKINADRLAEEKAAQKASSEKSVKTPDIRLPDDDVKTPEDLPFWESNPWIMRGIYIIGGLIALAFIYSMTASVIEKVQKARKPKWQPPPPRHVQGYKKPDKIPFHKHDEK